MGFLEITGRELKQKQNPFSLFLLPAFVVIWSYERMTFTPAWVPSCQIMGHALSVSYLRATQACEKEQDTWLCYSGAWSLQGRAETHTHNVEEKCV